MTEGFPYDVKEKTKNKEKIESAIKQKNSNMLKF